MESLRNLFKIFHQNSYGQTESSDLSVAVFRRSFKFEWQWTRLTKV